MAKFADITPFYEWLDWLEKESNSRSPEYDTMMFYEIRDKLDDLPEVVLCKDCKHFTEGMAIGMCKRNPEKHILPIPYNHFCSYGERRTNAPEESRT
jgi:hypothetical protein